ncbi:MAG: M23 family metallopeptidase [bacterium]|nr:M23 family metallopeptidase [bacterium]
MIGKLCNKRTIIAVTAFLLIAVVVFYSKFIPSVNSERDYIKWVDFKVTCEAMECAMKIDIETHTQSVHIDWIQLLAATAVKNAGEFKQADLKYINQVAKRIKDRESIEDIVQNMKLYNYYFEAYQAVLGGFVGEHEIQETDANGQQIMVKKYGLKAFSPIAKNYPYSHYEDFGAQRSYGFKRKHLGNDLLGQVGTPLVAVEGGIVEAMGWNKYGGWRIGIRSFDGKRYYYYAHLRKGYPYKLGLKTGDIVQAGDVIGYLGRTGYSMSEDENNIQTPHLHFGLQLIFDESQKESDNEIWIDVYEIVEFLKLNSSEVTKIDLETKDYERVKKFRDLNTP